MLIWRRNQRESAASPQTMVDTESQHQKNHDDDWHNDLDNGAADMKGQACVADPAVQRYHLHAVMVLRSRSF